MINVLAGATLTVDLQGTLNNAGDVNVTGTAEINDNDVTNTGTLDVLAGGSLTFDNTTAVNNDDGDITVASTGKLFLNNASIDQDDSIGANAGSLTIAAGGTANLQGTAVVTDGTTGTGTTPSIDHTTSFTNTGKLLANGDSHRSTLIR